MGGVGDSERTGKYDNPLNDYKTKEKLLNSGAASCDRDTKAHLDTLEKD